MSSTIQSKAMLANLSISQWTARKYDKSVSEDVEIANQAKDAGRYNKQLVDKKLLAGIAQIAGQIRDFHYTNTLPWGDNGDRLLPSARYIDYTRELRAKRDAFSTAVSALVHAYPAEVQAARTRLGKMYKPDEYPDASELYARFDVSVSFMPVPDANDFRVDINEQDAAKIKEQITATVDDRTKVATRELWARLEGSTCAVALRLGDPNAIFRDSLIGNLRELTELIPKLNISGDEELARICSSIRQSILIDPDRLRADPDLRASTAVAARQFRNLCIQHLGPTTEDEHIARHFETIP